jgi:hypothetical protein
LISIRKDGWDSSRVELDFIVLHLDEVHRWIGRNQTQKSRLN